MADIELMSISQVSKSCGISPRMLRYYEQAGLIESRRDQDNDYRLYDAAAMARVQQIIVLRKLQIPVKQICVILKSPDAAAVIDIFKRNIAEVDAEITALSTIRRILDGFISELEKITDLKLRLDFLSNETAIKLAGALTVSQKNTRERISMGELDRAADVLNRLRDVRIIYLPPMTVAAARFSGEGAPESARRAIDDFVRERGLIELKPDLRAFRFDLTNATGQLFGAEAWVSVPDDIELPAQLTRKRFLGGQYAAHVIGEDGYLTTLGLQDYINESESYRYDYDGNLGRVDPPIDEIDSFGGTRLNPEEILNYPEALSSPGREEQYDMLLPVTNYAPEDGEPAAIPGSLEKCGFAASIVKWGKFKIIGFTRIMTPDSGGPEKFEEDLKADGRLNILMRAASSGAPVLGFGSQDMDSQLRGGWRWTVCIRQADATDPEAIMAAPGAHAWTVDASRWLIFEHRVGQPFDDHATCMKLGYTWNGLISGSFYVRPEGRIGAVTPENAGDISYCWYPVKYEEETFYTNEKQ